MTDAEVKAISEVLTYISRLVVDIRADTKAMREARTREASSVSQELRRLRERVAMLSADRKSYRKVSEQLSKLLDIQPDRHEENVKKKRNWSSK